jgi:hypothetical protein
MKYELYSHRFADIILNSDYALKQEIEQAVAAVSFEGVARGTQCTKRLKQTA